ncbi:MAG: CBS domain-containing protein [Acidobacteriota bacterium]|nr:MAG: CBS domain-containing protein [Acidobacteriota bacterium]
MGIPSFLNIPLVSVAPGDTVYDAAKTMKETKHGAVVVLDGEKLVGIFSERDLMTKVVVENRDPQTTKVKDVMVSSVITVSVDDSVEDALKFMSKKHIRHLPLLDKKGKPVAMVSIRDILRHRMKELHQESESLAAYFMADGPGG